MTMDFLMEQIEVLNLITKIQADVIKDLFLLLGLYMTSDEIQELPAIKKINEAAKLKADLKLE
ncbi:MAG: hypothetical protein IKE02_04580 [Lachnospiraceae bacterium]|nr:hypothetical protein [Lachnospiraceae bacterium]